jgi:hypothetical protein
MTSSNPVTSADHLLIVGRDREIATIEEVLARRHPALIVVSGEVGVGKTFLSRQIEERAVTQGWQTVCYPSGGHLSISADTTTASITELVRRVPVTAQTSTADIVARTASSQEGAPVSYDLVEQLRVRAPLLFLIDGYRPSPELNAWFRAAIDGLKQSAAAVIVLVAEITAQAEDLVSFADDVIRLEPLDADAVRQHFEREAGRLKIELSAAELDSYVQAVCRNMGALVPLIAVLQLARPRSV